jgi:transcriptional regulator with XRE-family HTH domain
VIIYRHARNMKIHKGGNQRMRNIDSKAFRKAMIDADFENLVQLEEGTQVNKITLSNIIKGDQKPSYDTIAKLADAFHLTYEEIGRIFFTNDLA